MLSPKPNSDTPLFLLYTTRVLKYLSHPGRSACLRKSSQVAKMTRPNIGTQDSGQILLTSRLNYVRSHTVIHALWLQ